ncbi:MAG: S8 family serine peptidase, partial [Armatimonadota bacterium]|nr:S8 family serine peptidase [Armatimonadota bacterium]
MGVRVLFRNPTRPSILLRHYFQLAVVILLLVLCLSALAQPEVSLVPPPEPDVKPLIVHPIEMDRDLDKVADAIQKRVRDIHNAIAQTLDPARKEMLKKQLDAPVRVELIFNRQITQKQLEKFITLGGKVEHIYRAVSYGWTGLIPIGAIELLPMQMGDHLVAIIEDQPVELHLDEATRTGRVRPVWAPGFAGSPSGYSGTSGTTIAVIDTGLDSSHTDLSGRMQYWKDWTSDNEPNPIDHGAHGTHVAGIALGTGAACGSSTQVLYYTDSGNMSGLNSGYFYPSPIHIPNGLNATFTSTATWIGGDTTSLYGLYRANGSTGSYSALSSASSGSSPLTETNTFTSSSAYHYSAALIQNQTKRVEQYAVANSVTYSGVGDGFNTFSGVAPACKWAGLKVFKNDGTGSTTDIGEALDDIVSNRITHKIKVANMSLGIIGSPGLSPTLRAKTNTAVNNGIVVVCSAGNDGPGTGGANQIDDPGRAALAITVAASNDINELTQYTSSGFSSPASDEDYKPDVMAPGGSYYYSLIISADTNNSDAEISSFADVRANDYCNMAGTSMASPFVAGAAALVIQALEEGGLVWNFNSNAHPLLVKMLLCATCTESNANREVNSGTNPTLGRASAPKDLFEGYGLINPDAAIEAVKLVYDGSTIVGSTNGGYYDKRAWARKVNLTSGVPFVVNLDVPSTGDFDLYLYAGTPDSKGNPIIRAYSTNAGNGVDEAINYTPTTSETGYLVIKRVSGYGTWSLLTPDSTPPSTPVVTDDGAFTTSTTTIHAVWSALDPESGVAEYQYAISTTKSESGIIPNGGWVSSGTQQSGTRTGLSLSYGQVYYVLVKARNGVGLWSNIGVSDGITVVQNTP